MGLSDYLGQAIHIVPVRLFWQVKPFGPVRHIEPVRHIGPVRLFGPVRHFGPIRLARQILSKFILKNFHVSMIALPMN